MSPDTVFANLLLNPVEKGKLHYMNDEHRNSEGIESGRQAVRHYFWYVVALALAVGLWVWSVKPVAGYGALCSFAGMLIPAWQLSSKDGIEESHWRDLAPAAKKNLILTALGIVLTAVGYGVGIPTMFEG